MIYRYLEHAEQVADLIWFYLDNQMCKAFIGRAEDVPWTIINGSIGECYLWHAKGEAEVAIDSEASLIKWYGACYRNPMLFPTIDIVYETPGKVLLYLTDAFARAEAIANRLYFSKNYQEAIRHNTSIRFKVFGRPDPLWGTSLPSYYNIYMRCFDNLYRGYLGFPEWEWTVMQDTSGPYVETTVGTQSSISLLGDILPIWESTIES